MGRSHDRATQLLALPFGLLWTPWLGWPGLAVAAGAFLVGGLWLSPDLDTRSLATRRWGPLRVLWWPYRHLIRHRSILSHSPLLGTLLRLLYLALIAFAVLVAMLAELYVARDQEWDVRIGQNALGDLFLPQRFPNCHYTMKSFIKRNFTGKWNLMPLKPGLNISIDF